MDVPSAEPRMQIGRPKAAVCSAKNASAAPTDFKRLRIHLAAGDAPCRVRRGGGLLELDHDPSRPLLVRRLHDPDLGIGMGERDLAQSTLRMFIEHTRLDAGLRQPVQKQMRLGQVRCGTQTEHDLGY
jgi:hypothetical protein